METAPWRRVEKGGHEWDELEELITISQSVSQDEERRRGRGEEQAARLAETKTGSGGPALGGAPPFLFRHTMRLVTSVGVGAAPVA